MRAVGRLGETRQEALLWGASALAVIALHVGLFLTVGDALVQTHPPAPQPAVLLDLASPPPQAVSAPALPAPPPAPPPPDLAPTQPPPPAPLFQTTPPPAQPAPVEPPDLALPVPKPAPPRIERAPRRPPPARTRPPATPAPEPATRPAPEAPRAPAPPAGPVHLPANWQQSLFARLEYYKRYPPSAEQRRETGTALIRFTMDRQGHVLAKSLARSSGYPDLDRASLALLDRAQPLPALPPSVPQNEVEIVVPVHYALD